MFWKVAGFAQPSPIEVRHGPSSGLPLACVPVPPCRPAAIPSSWHTCSIFHFPCNCSSPPMQQILDRNEYTLEELLDEDDIIQECKSLNGRLVAL